MIATINIKTATIEIKKSIISKLDESYDLCYTDYKDHFNESPDTIQKVLDSKSLDSLFDEDNDWRFDEQH